jgi:hypothetical protein
MKKKIIQLNQLAALSTAALLGLTSPALAQNVSISPTGNAPDNSAALDIRDYTDKGVLIPRIALTGPTDVTTIPSPALSLLVYNTGTGGLTPAGYYYWDGSRWVRLVTMGGSPSDAWLTLGNAGTNPTTHFVGTTDNVDLVFRTNNTEKMRITNAGNVIISNGATDGPRLIWRGGTGGTQEYRARVHPSGYLGFFPVEAGNPGHVGDVLVLTQSGNVGIGTAPSTKLDVNGGALFSSVAGGTTGHVKILSSVSIAGQGGLLLTQIAGYTAGTGAFKLYNTNTGGLGGNLHIAHVDQGTPDAVANLVTIHASGRVGIGTTNPLRRLHVSGGRPQIIADGYDGVIGSRCSHGSFFHLIGNYDGWDSLAVYIAGYNANNPDGGNVYNSRAEKVHIGHPERLTVNLMNGNVGIGTTTPAQKLDVAGNVQFSGALMPAGNAGTSGQVLVSQGAGTAPQWQSPSNLTGFWKLLYVDAWNSSSTSNLGWSCPTCDGPAPYLTTCGTVKMLGGYGMCGNGDYFEKTFTGLPPHTEVMVEAFWWSVDSWDQNNNDGIDLVALSIDGTEVSRATPYGPYTGSVRNTSGSVCGWGGMVDIGPQPIVGWAAHTAANVTVRITNLANQSSTDESMGIVMVRVWVK